MLPEHHMPAAVARHGHILVAAVDAGIRMGAAVVRVRIGAAVADDAVEVDKTVEVVVADIVVPMEGIVPEGETVAVCIDFELVVVRADLAGGEVGNTGPAVVVEGGIGHAGEGTRMHHLAEVEEFVGIAVGDRHVGRGVVVLQAGGRESLDLGKAIVSPVPNATDIVGRVLTARRHRARISLMGHDFFLFLYQSRRRCFESKLWDNEMVMSVEAEVGVKGGKESRTRGLYLRSLGSQPLFPKSASYFVPSPLVKSSRSMGQ